MTNSVNLAIVSLDRSATAGSVTSRQPDVLVIGAGVLGLTAAICLAEAGCSVTVAAAQRSPQIASAAAGAIWGPHLVGIDERVTRWGAVTLARLTELATDPGIGARRLVPDLDVRPVRGQVVVTGNPGLSEFFVGVGKDAGDVSYYFPHGDVAVLGGTEEMGNWSLEPDPVTAERILRACAEVQPRLRGATVAEHRVGLRPWRPSVRLEAETLDGGRTLLHNYGHGGAGVSLSWGCALDVTAVVLG